MGRKKKFVQPNISELSIDLLELIYSNISSCIDMFQFRAVCSSWRLASKNLKLSPLLKLPSPKSDDKTIFLLSPNNNTIQEFKNVPYKLQESHVCVGSSHGWLIVLDKKSKFFLLNLFARTQIPLPNCSNITKAVLSANPSHNKDYIVVSIHNNSYCLAFFGHGNQEWTEIKDGDYTTNKMYFDVVFSENFLYVLREKGSVDIWDFHQDCSFPKKHTSIQPSGPTKFTNSKRYYPIELFSDTLYLVLSSDDILLVVRHIGEFVTEDGGVIHEGECDSVCSYRTVKFDVYKMDMNREKWLEVNSLNDHILFLGGNQSFSVLAKDHPGYKANSIYFTDDYWDRINEDYMYGGHDMGVFSLEDGCVKQFCEIGLQKIEPPPFWVYPDW
ncbi:hypothetical protein HAX54_009594 [Datura stramonium]|uniref:KIB1-4 beta-propeller domain-containing protein n=1 Tax=Datura stramonium TaxID=4076 RepID=A0ABS8TEY8_DATST|nr:hypothetical protein [Datura stramonium]